MNKIKATLLCIVVFAILVGCQRQNNIENGEGFLAVKGGKIWYRVSGNRGKDPILLLHGGPGGTSYCFNSYGEIGKDRPVITFDQLGCGRSDRITDTTLMTVDSYVEQTRKLLDHLGVRHFYLYGHSWGSILATEYYLRYGDGVKGLILASPILSVKLWTADADTLISSLPDTISVILRNDKKGILQDASDVGLGMDVYLRKFGARNRPLSADLDSGFSQSAANVFEFLWGRSEFVATGALKNYDRTNELKRIDVPTLYIIGEFDEVRPSTAEYYRSLTPDARVSVTSGAGHLTMHDNPAGDIEAILLFLGEQDRR